MAIALRFAARSDVGLVRSNNQDSGYAGPSLLVIADGMGGHAGGDVASSVAIGELAPLDGESHGADAALAHLSEAVHAAHRELLDRVSQEPALSGMGTTVTAILRTGGRLALAHIGDSRAYVLRDGELSQITKDHTFVQRLVDDGRITLEEAEQHPQRSVLMRVLSDVIDDVEPDLSMREGKLGDRYLLCSDGLSSVVSFDTLRDTLAAGKEPDATCELLVQLALRSGAPDNVTCIVADVVDAVGAPNNVPLVVGAASTRQQPRQQHRAGKANSAAERAAELTAVQRPTPDEPDEEPATAARGRRVLRMGLAIVAVLIVLVLGGFGAYRWSQGQFYVGTSGGSVAIFRGLPQNVGPVTLSSVAMVARDVAVSDLPPFAQEQVEEGIPADDESAANVIVERLRTQAATCRAQTTQPTPTASSSPASTGTSTSSPSTSVTPATAAATTSAPSAGSTPTVTGAPGTSGTSSCQGIG
jgi:protein phosphatase